MQIPSLQTFRGGPGPGKTAAFKTKAQEAEEAAAQARQVEKEFLDYAQKSPAERIREAYLKRHGLTEESLAAKDPKEREKIEEEIKQEIKAKLGLDGSKKTGVIKDVTV